MTICTFLDLSCEDLTKSDHVQTDVWLTLKPTPSKGPTEVRGRLARLARYSRSRVRAPPIIVITIQVVGSCGFEQVLVWTVDSRIAKDLLGRQRVAANCAACVWSRRNVGAVATTWEQNSKQASESRFERLNNCYVFQVSPRSARVNQNRFLVQKFLRKFLGVVNFLLRYFNISIFIFERSFFW